MMRTVLGLKGLSVGNLLISLSEFLVYNVKFYYHLIGVTSLVVYFNPLGNNFHLSECGAPFSPVSIADSLAAIHASSSRLHVSIHSLKPYNK